MAPLWHHPGIEIGPLWCELTQLAMWSACPQRPGLRGQHTSAYSLAHARHEATVAPAPPPDEPTLRIMSGPIDLYPAVTHSDIALFACDACFVCWACALRGGHGAYQPHARRPSSPQEVPQVRSGIGPHPRPVPRTRRRVSFSSGYTGEQLQFTSA